MYEYKGDAKITTFIFVIIGALLFSLFSEKIIDLKNFIFNLFV